MKKNVALFVLLSFCFLSCERTDDKTYKAYYPSQFEMQGIKYICDYDWAVEHRNEYTLGKIIGYLIYIEDEEDFIKSYPGIEYVTFDVVIGKQYEDKYDRVPVYEINEYKDRSIVTLADISNTYVQIDN